MRLRQPELGLRARVTLAFAAGALALSAALSGVSYGLVRNYLVEQSETAALREAFVNAGVTRDGLRTSDASIPRILTSLQDPDGSPSLVFYDDNWFSSKPLVIAGEPRPSVLRQAVTSGRPSRQAAPAWPALPGWSRAPHAGGPCPYFGGVSLASDQPDHTLRVLGLALLGAKVATTVAGAAVGRWASTRLRPVAEVTPKAAPPWPAALETRLPDIDDADLATLTSSFNSMADALRPASGARRPLRLRRES